MASYYKHEVINLTYDELLSIADDLGLAVKEKPLTGYNGRIKGYKIAIRKNIPTLKEKSCILAEEIGHYLINTGDILDQSKTENRKQELKARSVAYDIQIGLSGLIEAYKANCTSAFTVADYLGVTETFLKEAVDYYRSKYGICTTVDNYIVYFEPALGVMKMINR
jgi:Zn-dependent peptidase ImmA (M78 family)